jgi:hypothetical protein
MITSFRKNKKAKKNNLKIALKNPLPRKLILHSRGAASRHRSQAHRSGSRSGAAFTSRGLKGYY